MNAIIIIIVTINIIIIIVIIVIIVITIIIIITNVIIEDEYIENAAVRVADCPAMSLVLICCMSTNRNPNANKLSWAIN